MFFIGHRFFSPYIISNYGIVKRGDWTKMKNKATDYVWKSKMIQNVEVCQIFSQKYKPDFIQF